MKPESFERLWDELSRDACDEILSNKTNSDQLGTLLKAISSEKIRRRSINRCVRSTVALSLLLACSLVITNAWRAANPRVKNDPVIQSNDPSRIEVATLKMETPLKRPRGRLIIVEEKVPTTPQWHVKPISDEELLEILPAKAKLISTPGGKKLVLE